jgi:hypothetical protein
MWLAGNSMPGIFRFFFFPHQINGPGILQDALSDIRLPLCLTGIFLAKNIY